MAYKDPERAREYQREWRRRQREMDPEPSREANRKSYAKNRETRLAKMQEYREGHRGDLAERERIRRLSDPALERKRRLLRVYGITVEEYDRRLADQGGVCAICGGTESPLSVDHCHESKRVRGLLCKSCNLGLGKFGDSAETLRRALAYLLADTC
jgi:hypothetical protein